MNEEYIITEGWDGPIAGGPYGTYEAAIIIRRTMRRPWRMIWRLQRYCVQPASVRVETAW